MASAHCSCATRRYTGGDCNALRHHITDSGDEIHSLQAFRRRRVERRTWSSTSAWRSLQRRKAVHEQLRIGMSRPAEDRAHRSLFHQLAGIHHPDAAGKLRHQPHVMPDQNDRRIEILLRLGQCLHHLALDDHVERAGGSSAMIKLGSRLMASAMQTRCFMPPLNWWGYMSATPGCSPTRSRSSLRRAPTSSLTRQHRGS